MEAYRPKFSSLENASRQCPECTGKLYLIKKPISRPKCNSPEKDFADYFKFMADESDVMSILSFYTSPEFTADLRVKYCLEVMKDIEIQVGFYKNSGKYLIMKEIYSLKLEKGQSFKDHLLEMRRLFKSLSRMGYKMVQEELVHLMWFSLTDEIRTTPRPAAAAKLMDGDWIDELGDLSCPECGSKDICAHSMDIDQLDIGLPDTPGIFMIVCLITSYESWILDTGNGNHICNHLQGFKRRETLRMDRSNLRVSEGTMLVAEAVESYNVSLPSGLVLELENCYYVPKMIKNVISFDLLVDQATPSNGLYVLNLQENKEVYHISKRSKEIEDQTYLWHCRLGHINKKRIEQLQKGRLLGSFDFRPFNNYESCLYGKMTKQPFYKDNERANKLLGMICYVYLIRHKSEAFERFKEFQNEVQNQLDRKIKFLRSDRGGEYLSQEFDNHMMECGIVSQLTPPYTPQMNGVSERRNRTLPDMIWGYEVYVKRPTSEKLKPKSDKCIFVGYPNTTVGYYFYNPTKNKVFVARNGEFLEDKFLSTENTRNDVDLQEVEEDDTLPIVEPVTQQEPIQTQPETDEGDLNEPTSYGKAVSGMSVEQWQEAMEAEMQSMYDNQVWELTDLPQHCRAVGRKWVFKKKTDMDGNVHTFKARLVAKVAMLKSIRILMAISAYCNYEIWQMDVKTAFLNEKLTEDIYMQQPEGFVDPKNPNKSVKAWLSKCFEMKDLGEAANILGIKIYRKWMGDNQPLWGRRSKVHFTPRSAIKRIEDKDIEISEELIKMIGKVTFDGKPTEEPYQHLEAFEDICDLFKTKGDEVKLRLFHFTLTGKVKDWFRKLAQESIDTWEELKSAFLVRHFPLSKINRLKDEIRDFKQGKEILRKFGKEKEARKLLDDLEAHHLDWSTNEEETKPVQLSEVTATQEELRYKCEGQGTVSTNIDQQIQIFASHIACLHKGLGHILRAAKETYPHVHTDTEDPAEVFITTRGGKVVEGPSMPEANQIPNFQVVEPEAELPSNQTEGGKEEVVRPKESVPIPNPARVPYPARLRKEKKEAQYRKFIDLIKQVNINVPLVDLIAGMPNYMKFIKELVSNKANLGAEGITFLNAECSAILSDTPKKGDPGSFTIPCHFGKSISFRALVELGASINLMPLSFYQKLGLGDLKDTRMTIQLADRSIKYPVGIAKDVLVQVDKLVFPADFVILDIKDEVKVPLILGRPFLNTAQAVINVAERQLSLGIGEDRITFSIDQAMSYAISTDDRDYEDDFNQSFEMELNNHLYETRKVEHENMEIPQVEGEDKFEDIKQENKVRVKTSLEEPPDLELKDLSEHLRYQFLEGTNSLPVIISFLLKPEKKSNFLQF
ncbi:hypothetical protein OSB04_020149 [Centaurea solstitialis]|uniref:Integrase catalytic domain-containing protein n=1 Tax=Centaurea solstitialis TaxID=347529 RepID=A0AA38T532_9ASTR|nr:hypothetical protein OSB04_020149 [Centaurea solstitialis]